MQVLKFEPIEAIKEFFIELTEMENTMFLMDAERDGHTIPQESSKQAKN